MLNKDKGKDISKALMPVQFDTVIRKTAPANDIRLHDELIKEVNSLGYHIQYYWQLHEMELCDRQVYPVIRKYIGQFENERWSIDLITCLDVPKMYEATEYLLDLYRNDTLKEPSSVGPMSVRWGCANALYKIKDPRYQKEYRELINIPGMWDGGWLMIELLGKFKTEENYEFILSHVNNPIMAIRSSAVKALGGFKSHAKQLIPLLEGIIISDEIQGIKEPAKNSHKKLVRYGEKHPEVLV